jgi:uncharacterized protein Usg
VKFFFQIFFGYRCSAANLGFSCKYLGGLGPLVKEEIETAQTIHKSLAKLLYRFTWAWVEVCYGVHCLTWLMSKKPCPEEQTKSLTNAYYPTSVATMSPLENVKPLLQFSKKIGLFPCSFHDSKLISGNLCVYLLTLAFWFCLFVSLLLASVYYIYDSKNSSASMEDFFRVYWNMSITTTDKIAFFLPFVTCWLQTVSLVWTNIGLAKSLPTFMDFINFHTPIEIYKGEKSISNKGLIIWFIL